MNLVCRRYYVYPEIPGASLMSGNPIVQNILIFQNIAKHPADLIAAALRDEADAVQAAIIARFDGPMAKNILQHYPLDTQKSVLMRMSEGVQVPGDILTEVLQSVLDKLDEFSVPGGAPVDGAEKVADILRQVPGQAGEDLLEALRAKDPNLAGSIKDRMFVYSDIPKLNDTGLAKALIRCDNRLLAMAMKGAPPEIVEKIQSNLSPRRRQLVEEERAQLGPRKKSEVDEKQMELVKFLRGQIEAGGVYMDDGSGGEQWVK